MPRCADPDLARKAATHVVRVLADAGFSAYLAGGCVRDALLNLSPTDFDVATSATPPDVRSLFPRTQEVGESFGVVLVSVRAGEVAHPGSDKAAIEVATFRSDGPYADARRPGHVIFSDPLNDAQRRDFTINALFLDPLAPSDGSVPASSRLAGRLIDFVGGVQDLKDRILRAVGDPDQRLREDHLRALRAVRFAARLGFTLDTPTAEAITRHASELRGVSKERIGEELRRMLAHPAAADALAMLQSLTLDAPVLREPTINPPLPLVRALVVRLLGAGPPAMTVLASWLIDRARARLADPALWPDAALAKSFVSQTRAALCLSNDESDHLAGVLSVCHRLQQWAGLGVAQRKRLASAPHFHPALALIHAHNPADAQSIAADVHALSSDGVGVNPEPFVTGDDLVASGFTPGPRFKHALEAVYDAQLEGRVREKSQAMELARWNFQGG